MRVLEVDGESDYSVVMFEESDYGKLPYSEVYDLVMNEHDGEFEVDDGEDFFTITCLDFPGCVVTKDFLDFLNADKDYDTTKARDYFIVDVEGGNE